MKLYRLLSGPDDATFCARVERLLNHGWELHGAPVRAYDDVAPRHQRRRRSSRMFQASTLDSSTWTFCIPLGWTVPWNAPARRRKREVLELRPNCECCDRDLPPDSPDARICTFECTFCATCVDQVFGGVCPNCGGDFVQRPVRPAHLLARNPPSTVRRLRAQPCGPAAATSEPRDPVPGA